MKRITARLGDEAFVKTTSDANEKDYLMHIEILFPENTAPEPILRTVTTEGKAHEFLKTVNNLKGHKTGFEVYLSPVGHGPVVELLSPRAGLFVCSWATRPLSSS